MNNIDLKISVPIELRYMRCLLIQNDNYSSFFLNDKLIIPAISKERYDWYMLNYLSRWEEQIESVSKKGKDKEALADFLKKLEIKTEYLEKKYNLYYL
jgi:hypothetical protein